MSVDYYLSPRVTGEILDCSMPMTFDQYSNCGFNCLYCFSTYQRSIDMKGYWEKNVKPVNVKRVKDIFTLKCKSVFSELIKQKTPLQWGGLSDPMCPFEKKMGTGLELLKFFREIDYPVNFSTKSDMILTDKRYQDAFRDAKNFWVKVTIISLDEDKTKIIEAGAPTPSRRLEVLKKFNELGVRTTLRLRPFLFGLSEHRLEELIKRASEAGVESLSTEFFCLEARATDKVLARYKKMSGILGYDLLAFYKKNSSGSGYLRLNRGLKRRYIDQMEGFCKKYGLRFYVSDADFKERCHNGSCCGLPKNDKIWGKYQKSFTEAIVFAKEHGSVRFSDINEGFEWCKTFNWLGAPGYNCGHRAKQLSFKNFTMYEWIRYMWNHPNSLKSPYKYFGGLLRPDKIDEHGDVVYIYKEK